MHNQLSQQVMDEKIFYQLDFLIERWISRESKGLMLIYHLTEIGNCVLCVDCHSFLVSKPFQNCDHWHLDSAPKHSKETRTFDQQMDKERTKRTCGGLIIGQRQKVLWKWRPKRTWAGLSRHH
ncbi:uncharacterized protein LOC141886554 isoform X2 [Acropora palmata]|uniref:uncharacterized protein LOC141886554 isoform X2 n=2 Tax=Acropora palmata TaxID=6131 RepID=UPI003DA13912